MLKESLNVVLVKPKNHFLHVKIIFDILKYVLGIFNS